MYSALNDALQHVAQYTGSVKADLCGKDSFQFSSLFQHGLRLSETHSPLILEGPFWG